MAAGASIPSATTSSAATGASWEATAASWSAFGKPISKFQNTQFKLVECATKLQIGRVFLDELVRQHVAGKHLVSECSMAKWWMSDVSQEVIDTCLQFFGGYGYMLEYPVARAFMDARVQRIYAGTNEIMKIIIAKQMGL